MEQYRELLKAIQEKGTYKPAAREGMPGTQSLFGYQFRHDLSHGFPALTTKKLFWKGVVYELLWFLQGDTNISYLVKNGVNIWNEDSFNYYQKRCKELQVIPVLNFEEFVDFIKRGEFVCEQVLAATGYKYGDCGHQYGKVWRNWEGVQKTGEAGAGIITGVPFNTDQIKNLIKSLRNTPESRRHLVSAIDPAHDNDLALYWCHAMFQFNCRPLTGAERTKIHNEKFPELLLEEAELFIPKYYLDCQLYQRSADVFLGVPLNIASYALLTHILAKICNMIPGEYIHSFGDVHIYDDHREAVELQLSREAKPLPTLEISDEGNDWAAIRNLNFDLIEVLGVDDFKLVGYDPHPAIKANLSTGMKK